jgi:hypothetical protein
MSDAPVTPPFNFFHGLIVGLAAIGALVAAFAVAAISIGWYAGVVAVIVLAVVVFGFGLMRRSGPIVAASLFGLTAAIIGGFDITAYFEARNGEVLRDVTVDEAAGHPKATSFYFREATVRTECEGAYLSRDSEGRSGYWHYAAPVVSDAAGGGSRVSVWAVCNEWGECRAGWRKPWKAGVRQSGFGDDWAKAIAASAARCQLEARNGAVVIEWVESPGARIEKYLLDFWSSVEIIAIAWLVVVLAGKGVWAWRRRRTRAEAGMPA